MSDGKLANPAPLGLLGFGMTTILLNVHNTGAFPVNSMILAMGIFVGGLAQVFAGVYEWKMGNTFGTAAFSLYGFFWLSFVGMVLLPGNAGAEVTDGLAKGLYLLVWGIFTLCMFIGTLKISRAHQVIFGSLALLFFMLAIGDITENHGLIHVAGWEGIFCGASAFYAAIAQILNEIYGKTVLPMGIVE
ncbi:MAG: acetate uptake transporter [Spirochaetales bacterium]|nr:acetate uptake transporter [Spirochaetales bacterium]